MMERFAIIHVAETLKGGIASYLDEILSSQVERLGEGNVHLLIPSSQLSEVPICAGVIIHVFADRKFRFGNVITIALALRNILACTRVEIVHLHSTFAGFAARFLLRNRRQRPKLVYCAHGWAFERECLKLVNFVIGRIELFLSRWTDKIVCISRHDFDSAMSLGIEMTRLITIPNAISSEIVLSSAVEWPVGAFRFLFVGRFDKQKGHDLFIEAMRHLGDRAYGCLIGSWVVSKKMQSDLLPANVGIKGWLSRPIVQSYLASADIVVIPSRWEGFGLIALEAMRVGRPVIATRVGGLVEIVVNGETGILVEPNSVSALVEAMRGCMSGVYNLERFGKAASERFRSEYTSDRLNARLFALYWDLLYSDIH